MGPRVVVPATHEPVDLVRLVRQAELETRGILITQEGAPKAVLLSVEEYARLTSDEAAQAGEGNNRWVVWLAKAAKLRAEMLARRGAVRLILKCSTRPGVRQKTS